MPKVLAQGKTIKCVNALANERRLVDKPLVRFSLTGEEKRLVVRHGSANLRKVLLHNGIDLYNGSALFINCRGIGSCGTRAVKVEGEVSPTNWRDVRLLIAHALPFSYIKPT
ncbi:hypothetical protein [Plectonema radiosum]|uniref:hypothetical protein n=1 Tax=Plectonema radiosum TaxID=945768 RepID=UPI0029823FB6|nr:hypothetical protein [Plectonema radiosum]